MDCQKVKEKLVIRLVEYDISWEDKTANLNSLDNYLSAPVKADIIILPEMFTTGFSMVPAPLAEPMNGNSMNWLMNKSKELDAAICGSLIIVDQARYYNRFVFVTPQGQISTYDKRHLFSFAGEDECYSRGLERVIIEYMGWRIMPQICYDLRFPVWSRSNDDVDLMIYVANWPEMRIAAWDTLLKARAIENLCYVAAVNRLGHDGNDWPYVGHSVVIKPDGTETGNTQIEAVISLNELQNYRDKFRFLNDRDQFSIQTRIYK